MSTIVLDLIEPLSEYPETGNTSKMLKHYYMATRYSQASTGIMLTIVCGIRIAKPVTRMLTMNFDFTDGNIDIPFGLMPWAVESVPFYVLGVAVSSTALLAAAVGHVCWYLSYVNSCFLLACKLRLICLDLKTLDDQAKDLCGDFITPFHYLARLKHEREAILDKCALLCLKEIVMNHVKIIRYKP